MCELSCAAVSSLSHCFHQIIFVLQLRFILLLVLVTKLVTPSLMVAALRHQMGDQREGRVVAIDARGDNLAFLQLSARLNNISDKMITYINNPVRCPNIQMVYI